MQSAGVCVYLALPLLTSALCQGTECYKAPLLPSAEGESAWREAVHRLSWGAALGPLPVGRPGRSTWMSRPGPKRSPLGSRYALSLDVPTSILSALIDIARNQDMHAKATANAELMARIG